MKIKKCWGRYPVKIWTIYRNPEDSKLFFYCKFWSEICTTFTKFTRFALGIKQVQVLFSGEKLQFQVFFMAFSG